MGENVLEYNGVLFDEDDPYSDRDDDCSLSEDDFLELPFNDRTVCKHWLKVKKYTLLDITRECVCWVWRKYFDVNCNCYAYSSCQIYLNAILKYLFSLRISVSKIISEGAHIHCSILTLFLMDIVHWCHCFLYLSIVFGETFK